jgi:hypothetical protein
VPTPLPDAGSEGGATAAAPADADGEAVAEPAVSVVSDTPASDARGPATDEAPGPGVADADGGDADGGDADGGDEDDFFAKLRAGSEERRKRMQEGRTGSPAGAAPAARVALGDVTAKDGSTIKESESPRHAFDGDIKTKWLHWLAATTWIQLRLPDGARKAFGGYSITSADDCPHRDPAVWSVQGSDDGREWTTLDTRTGERFSARHQTRSFRIRDPRAFGIYRLWIDKPLRAHDGIQISEFQLTGETEE